MPQMNPAPEAPTMDVRDYVRIMWRRKLTIVFAIAVVVGAAVALSMLQTPVYKSTTQILVRADASEALLTPEELRSAGSERGLATEIQLLRSPTIHKAAAEELGRAPSISVSGVGDTDVIAITAKSTEPEEAAEDANVYATTYLDQRRAQTVDDFLAAAQEVQRRIDKLNETTQRLETELSDVNARLPLTPEPDRAALEARKTALEEQLFAARQADATKRALYEEQLDELQVAANVSRSGSGQVIAEAGVPTTPVSPKPVRNAIAALGLGLLIGVGLAFLREHLDDSVKSKEDLERATGMTVTALIPTVPGWKNRRSPRLVSLSEPRGAPAEAYRTLRTSVQFLSLENPIRILQITSASAVEGKTTTLANLAVALAQAGQRVVVVCCDLRRPRLHEFFGLSNETGFTSVMLGETTLVEAIQYVGPQGSRLGLLASGPLPPNPSELLASQRAENVVASLADRCDLVLIDSPPVLPVTDALVISGLVDATLLIATAGTTTKRGIHRACEILRQVDAPLVGTVLNGMEAGLGYGYGYGYGGYGYGDGSDARLVPPAAEMPANGRRGLFRRKAKVGARKG